MSGDAAVLVVALMAAGIAAGAAVSYRVVVGLVGWADYWAEVRQARRMIARLEELGLDMDEFLEIEELEALYAGS
jgi:CRISPR/Cas system endoribonuclease Cas6 (RAMP superfamily)